MSGSCACGTPRFPSAPCNQAGLPAIANRIGDFDSFRQQLLSALPDETELTSWRPGVRGDLAVQMVDWWAYLGDILTFYNERIANESYLGTALLPESVNHLVQVLGYRPKPALGARGTLAALLTPSARPPLTIPAGLQIQSKPAPGQPPQIFEVDQATVASQPDVVAAVVATPQNLLGGTFGQGGFLWLAGTVTGIKPADRLLLINQAALSSQTIADYTWFSVGSVTPQSDPLGNPVTQLVMNPLSGEIAAGAQAGGYVLLRPRQSSPLWLYTTSTPVIAVDGAATVVTLAGPARSATPGSLMLLDVGDAAASATLTPTPVIAQSYGEAFWYANGSGPQPPPSSSPPITPLGFPVAQIIVAGFAATGTAATTWNENLAQITARWSWLPVGDLTGVLTTAELTWSAGAAALVPSAGAPAFATLPASVLLEDANGNAIAASATQAAAPATGITLGSILPQPPPNLTSPISVFFNLVPVSRGKTVAAEILGSGNPSVAGQDFPLAQSPVTYQFDPASISGPNFSSTVAISVNGVQWQEVQSFYGQAPNAQVFVLHEDDQGVTHASFGDGVNGALLPTGTNNVTATYRSGAGAATPAPETLTVLLSPTAGLKGVRNPVPPTGGGDADPPAQLSTLAPASVLTFDRAVSLDDYAAIALTASGVTQAVAGYTFDPVSQRPRVTLWIAGDAGAPTAATAALAATAMPSQGLTILTATAVPATLSLTYLLDPRYAQATVETALTTALLDPSAGLLGAGKARIGEPIYQSQIAAACLAVPGVTAIQNVALAPLRRFRPQILWRWTPPPKPAGCSGQCVSPGAGNYFSIPNDGQHLFLTAAPAS